MATCHETRQHALAEHHSTGARIASHDHRTPTFDEGAERGREVDHVLSGETRTDDAPQPDGRDAERFLTEHGAPLFPKQRRDGEFAELDGSMVALDHKGSGLSFVG